MQRHAFLYLLIGLAPTATAAEYTVLFQGEPATIERNTIGWMANTTIDDSVGPWTIHWKLPRTYEAVAPTDDTAWYMRVVCSTGIFTGTLPATSVSMSPTPFDTPVGEELRRFGSGSGTFGARVNLSTTGSELLRDISVTVPVSAIGRGGPAQCRLEVGGIGGSSAARIPLRIATFPLADLLPRMLQDAETAYGSTADQPDDARVEADLDALIAALVDGGCLLDAEVEDGISGAYGTNLNGFDSGDDLLDTVLNRSNQTFGATRFSGDRVGTPGFSKYNGAGKLYADRDDGGFVAGHWYRGAGRRGVFHTVTGTCDGGAGAKAALDSWFGGGLL